MNKKYDETINEKTVPNKYVRWFCYVLLFRYVWDITTLLEKYLPMQKVYKILGLGWTKLGYYVFWLLWFILLVVGLYHLLGEETFNMIVNEIAE
jgi:hypothetical protein